MGHAFVIESAIFTKGESLTAKMLRLDHKHLFRIFYKLTYGRSCSIFMHMAFDFVSSVTKTISNCNFFTFTLRNDSTWCYFVISIQNKTKTYSRCVKHGKHIATVIFCPADSNYKEQTNTLVPRVTLLKFPF